MNIDKTTADLLAIINEITANSEDLAIFVVVNMKESVEKGMVVSRILSNIKTEEIPQILGQISLSMMSGGMQIVEAKNVKLTGGTDVVQ